MSEHSINSGQQEISTGSDGNSSRPTVEQQAGARLFDEADALRASAITDFKQAQCTRQPGPGEVPVMKAGKATSGCEYQDLNKVAKETGVLNVPDLWKTGSDSTARIVLHARKGTQEGITQGTGVAIGKVGDQCVIATARHVVESTPKRQILNSAVEMNDGNLYKYDVKIMDSVSDRAVIAVKTGDKTDALCHPVKAGESVMNSGHGVIVSYPGNTNSKHLSMAGVEGSKDAAPYVEGTKGAGKEITAEAHTKKGSSGAPMFDTSGKLRALVTRGPIDGRPDDDITVLAPVTAKDQRRWMDEFSKSK
ncbi:MAG: serine protease [Candidatus Obscuribacterales bacterium]|nr:serine protease [Candidatus Obscuribacterales bacterium]